MQHRQEPQCPTLRGGLSLAKRQQIVMGAIEVFILHGFEGTSMDAVARHSGVSKGTLYNYFDSKQALFTAIIEQECERIRGNVFSLDTINGPPEKVLTAVGVGLINSIIGLRELAIARTVMAESHKFPELGQAFEAAGPEQGNRLLGQYLLKLSDSGILDIDDASLAARQFIAMCEAGLLRRAQLNISHPSPEEVKKNVAVAVRVFIKGYAK
jgi:TetR/AcrR family transcriptional regulator, mexJK operon transcriptional repressor